MGRKKEEVNSCTMEEKEGKSCSKVNDAGKDELERKERMYRGQMNFKGFFILLL